MMAADRSSSIDVGTVVSHSNVGILKSLSNRSQPPDFTQFTHQKR